MCGVFGLVSARSDPKSRETPAKQEWGAVLDPTTRTGRGVTEKQGKGIGKNRNFQGLVTKGFRNL